MRYFDTSFLVPLFLSEPTSAAIQSFFSAHQREELSISHWTKVEFSSLLAVKQRMNSLDAQATRSAATHFEEAVRSFALFLPTISDFELARTYIANFDTGLRGGDALHLAIAHNRDIETIHSLDKKLLRAGRMLGLPVSGDVR